VKNNHPIVRVHPVSYFFPIYTVVVLAASCALASG
jgi:hypothetical protein